MILQALVAYADREGLGDLDFDKRPVDYELRIGDDGRFVGLVPLSLEKKRAPLSQLPIGPPSKNNPGYPSFVVDNAQYVLGTAKQTAKAGNAEKCFASYLALVAEAAAASQDGALVALERFLDRPEERERADAELNRLEQKAGEKRGDRVLVPALDSDGARRIHEREAVRAWWQERRDNERCGVLPPARGLLSHQQNPHGRTAQGHLNHGGLPCRSRRTHPHRRTSHRRRTSPERP